jgi:hypothetical protein
MLILLSLFLWTAQEQMPSPPQSGVAGTAQPAAPAAPAPEVATIFKTSHTVPELEKCLTEKLSAVGEVTSVPIEGTKTLMFRTVDEPPMMIDLAPATVKVTTKFALWTRPIIETCL